MSKIYKGYELIKAINDGEIKEESKFKVSNNCEILKYKGDALRWENNGNVAWVDNFTNKNVTFELIEEDTINIKIIREIPDLVLPAKQGELNVIFQERINELIRAVKQLDKRTKEKE